MKVKISFLAILTLISGNIFASDLLYKIKQMSKEEYLNIFPSALNNLIIQSGGKVQAGAGTNMIGVQRVGNLMVIIFEMETGAIKRILSNTKDAKNTDVNTFIKSEDFKENMFGSKGKEKQFMINQTCTDPIKLEVLKKGIITKYRYLLDTGEHLGEVTVSIGMCEKI